MKQCEIYSNFNTDSLSMDLPEETVSIEEIIQAKIKKFSLETQEEEILYGYLLSYIFSRKKNFSPEFSAEDFSSLLEYKLQTKILIETEFKRLVLSGKNVIRLDFNDDGKDEFIQEVKIALFKSIRKGCRIEETPSQYISGIVNHICCNTFRQIKDRKQKPHISLDDDENPLVILSNEHSLEYKHCLDCINDCVKRLEPKKRALFLRYFPRKEGTYGFYDNEELNYIRQKIADEEFPEIPNPSVRMERLRIRIFRWKKGDFSKCFEECISKYNRNLKIYNDLIH